MTHRASLVVATVLLILLALYVGSYFALVQPGFARSSLAKCPVEYRVGGSVVKLVFAPIHGLDRGLRPWVWGNTRERMNGSPWKHWWRAERDEEPS